VGKFDDDAVSFFSTPDLSVLCALRPVADPCRTAFCSALSTLRAASRFQPVRRSFATGHNVNQTASLS